MKRMATPPGAPSYAAHAAFVEATLALVERGGDARLYPTIQLGWSRARTMLGAALIVPAGWYYSSTGACPDPRGLGPRAKRAPVTLARLTMSAPLWVDAPARERGATIAHELAHLSEHLDAHEDLARRVARGATLQSAMRAVRAERTAHGIHWIRWTRRYSPDRPLAVTCARRTLTGEHAGDLGAVELP